MEERFMISRQARHIKSKSMQPLELGGNEQSGHPVLARKVMRILAE
jgi:hypothetical protein